MFPFITAALSLLLIVAMLFVFRRWEGKSELILKCMTVAFCLLGLFRLLLADGFVETVFNFEHPLETLLRWGYWIGYAVLPMAVFTDSRLFRNIAAYFSAPISLLSILFMNTTMAHFFDGQGYGFTLTPALRYIFYILELILALSIPVLTSIRRKHKIDIKNYEELFNLTLGLPAVLLQMMPVYVPQALVGYSNIPYDYFFAPFHLAWILFIITECVILYLYFRHRTEKDKYHLLLFLVIAQLFHTMSIFLRGFTLSRMPIQLCSIAAFFYFFTVVFKSRKLFGFCFLTNIVGALVAIFLAAFDVGALSFWTLHYMYEHTFVMLMPVLALSLGVFPRLTRSDLVPAIGIFSIYFLGCFGSGMIINSITGKFTVNYFYMFNLEVALEYVPFASFTGAIELAIGTLKVYPLLILVIYTVFVLLITGLYALMQGIYRLSDWIRHKREERFLVRTR